MERFADWMACRMGASPASGSTKTCTSLAAHAVATQIAGAEGVVAGSVATAPVHESRHAALVPAEQPLIATTATNNATSPHLRICLCLDTHRIPQSPHNP